MTTRDNRGRFGRKRDGMSNNNNTETSGENILPEGNDATHGALDRALTPAEIDRRRFDAEQRRAAQLAEMGGGFEAWTTNAEGHRVPVSPAAQRRARIDEEFAQATDGERDARRAAAKKRAKEDGGEMADYLPVGDLTPGEMRRSRRFM